MMNGNDSRVREGQFCTSPLCMRDVTESCLTLWDPMDCSQAPLSMGFSRYEYCSGLPCPPPGNLPDPEIEPRSPALQVDSLPWKPHESPYKYTRQPQNTRNVD